MSVGQSVGGSDKIFFSNSASPSRETQHIICDPWNPWNPWNQEYKLRTFTVMMTTIMKIRKLSNVLEEIIWGRIGVLMAFFPWQIRRMLWATCGSSQDEIYYDV